MFKKVYVTLGMLMAGVVPSFAELKVDDFQNANLEKGVQNVESGLKSGANIALNIFMYFAIVVGVGALLYGLYMAASKDSREEGKLKDGMKLAMLGVIFLTIGFVIKKISGI